MSTLMVNYDLMKPGQNYDDLIEYIKGVGAWWHYLQSTWFVRTNMSPTELRDKLNTFIDTNDKVLVVDMHTRAWAASGFPSKAYDWLRENL